MIRVLWVSSSQNGGLHWVKLVEVDGGVVARLISLGLRDCGIDGESYLEQEDVKTAWESGEITDLLAHFCNQGYFEDREVLPACFDADWYPKAYPDVAAAGISGLSTEVRRYYLD